jgi:hypothetical protein
MERFLFRFLILLTFGCSGCISSPQPQLRAETPNIENETPAIVDEIDELVHNYRKLPFRTYGPLLSAPDRAPVKKLTQKSCYVALSFIVPSSGKTSPGIVNWISFQSVSRDKRWTKSVQREMLNKITCFFYALLNKQNKKYVESVLDDLDLVCRQLKDK